METLTAVKPSEIEAEVAEGMARFDQGLAHLLEADKATLEKAKILDRIRSIGKTAAFRNVAVRMLWEGPAAIVDGAMLASTGVSLGPLRPFANTVGREVIGTVGDVLGNDKVNNWLDARLGQGEVLAEPEQQGRLRKAGGVLGRMAAMTAASVVAVKVGPWAADQLNPDLNAGFGAYAVPIGSKVGAAAGVGRLMQRRG